MGKESPWRCGDLNHVREDPEPPDTGQQKHMHESMVFPTTYTNASSFFPDFVPQHKCLDLNRPPFFPLSVTAAEKRFLVFDQSGDQTNLVYSSVGSPFMAGNGVGRDPWSDGANNVSAGGEEEEEEMHEDTEEIDALLYSDSEDGGLQEEEGSTGHHYSPIETVTAGSAGDVGSSSAKRKRRAAEADDALLADTASSSAGQWEEEVEEGEWSCAGGGGEEEEHRSKRMKRERIQETVGVLRRIIPGGRGKDAAAVLDEAIKYLRSITSGGL